MRAVVLASAASFPASASALAAVVTDTPVPDPALSAGLAALLPRLRAAEAARRAQAADVARLRARSEALVRRWYERRVLAASDAVAAAEARVARAERAVRRVQRARDEV